jgi:hypothetical protein
MVTDASSEIREPLIRRLRAGAGNYSLSKGAGHGDGWEMSAVLSRDYRQEQAAGTDREPDDAVEVLREVWAAKGQSAADLDEAFGVPKSCKRMQDVGFDGMAADDGDMRAAWRATLEREGKLGSGERSVRDLVLGPQDHRIRRAE